MSDYAWIAIVIIALVAGHWVGETFGWLVLGVGIIIALYLKRSERIRNQELRMAELKAQTQKGEDR